MRRKGFSRTQLDVGMKRAETDYSVIGSLVEDCVLVMAFGQLLQI
jgi:hypothetical protein